MEKKRFYICEVCGNIVGMIHDSGVPIMCCGQKMKALAANTTDAAAEKHVPEVTVSGERVSVRVGSTAHPMTGEHNIRWIYLRTEQGGARRVLMPGDAPEAVFATVNDRPLAVYAYCNLHGLWKKDI